MRSVLGLGVLVGIVGGCATADIPAVSNAASKVTIRKGDPSDEYQELGPLTATNGSGCGAFGELGTYEGAMAEMKNRAAAMKADYVRLDLAKEPYLAPNCRVNEYALRGVAFKRVGAPKPAAASAPAELKAGFGDLFASIGNLVGQQVVVRLKSGEVLAGTVASVIPPDGVQLMLLDQSARKLKIAEIEGVKSPAQH
jgi:hypothetical protein